MLLAGGQDVAAAAVQHVVAVLHSGDRGDPAGLGKLVSGDAAEPQLADQPLPLQLGQGAQRLRQRHVVGGQQSVAADAQVHQVGRPVRSRT